LGCLLIWAIVGGDRTSPIKQPVRSADTDNDSSRD
jgi:hypothetical protein